MASFAGRLAALWLLLATVVSSAMACGSDSSDEPPAPATETVRGLITDVTAASLFGIESLTVEDENGGTLTLQGTGSPISGFTSSHLREHMVLGHALTVTFHRDDGTLVIDGISD